MPSYTLGRMTQLNEAFTDSFALDASLQNADTISIREASSLLEVSPATVRNWQRHGYLSTTAKPHVARREVLSLKKRLVSGELDRLQKRANKKQAGGSFVPDEMVMSVEFGVELERILSHIKNHSLAIEASLCLLALKLCTLQQDAVLINKAEPLKLKSYSGWQRQALKNEVSIWLQDVKLLKAGTKKYKAYVELLDLLTEVHQADTLGVIYQSLLATGEKSKLGSYYTPQDIIIDILESYGESKGTLLDPCCGTGHFLLTAVACGYQTPEHLMGFDIDAVSVKIARLNLLFAFPDKDFVPKIYNLDTLAAKTQQLPETIDLIATNPPWGAVNKSAANKSAVNKSAVNKGFANTASQEDIFACIQSGESFSYFLLKCISMLEEGKCLSFILPESFLNVKQHADIRKYILDNCTVLGVQHLGRRFKGVYTPVIRLDLQNTKATKDSYCAISVARDSYKVLQSRFANNQHKCFDIFLSPSDESIIQAFYAKPHTNLKDKADWALGIVTGDNKKHISTVCGNGMEAIITGKDIQAYRLGAAQKFTHYEQGKFQQIAPMPKYKSGEKLIYKFISKRLVFAYDDQQHLTLNSANCLIPQLPNMPIKVLLALLNSKAYQFFFEKSFHTHKVLRGDLEALPLVLLGEAEQSQVTILVDEILESENCDVSGDKHAIDTIVYEALDLSKEQVLQIEQN